jgi:flagellar FliL protein
MADPENEAKAQPEAEAPAKKKSKLPLIIILVVVVLAGVGGGMVVVKMMGSGADKKKAPPPPTTSGLHIAKYKLDLQPFIVNLADPGGRRYLKVSLQLAFDDSSLADEIKRRLAEFQDAIIVLLRSKRYQDISTSAGMIKLRNELIQAINKRLPGPKVFTIHFTEFVVQ